MPLKVNDVKYLHKCIIFKLKIGGKICKIVSLYRSPGQNRDVFEKFLKNLKLSIDHMADKNPYIRQNQTYGMLMTTKMLKNQKLTF